METKGDTQADRRRHTRRIKKIKETREDNHRQGQTKGDTLGGKRRQSRRQKETHKETKPAKQKEETDAKKRNTERRRT